MTLQPTDLAYIAGFVDADGWISFRYQRATERYYLSAGVTQKKTAILEYLSESFGGSIYTRPNGVSNWVVNSNVARTFLEAILPYMNGKAEVAEAGIAMDEAPYEEREDIAQAMRQLNA